jgi:hypothetical protein
VPGPGRADMARFTITKDSRQPGEVWLREEFLSLRNTDRFSFSPTIVCADVEEAYAIARRGEDSDTIFWAHLNAILPAWITPERAEDLKQRGILHHVAIKEAA